MDAFILTLRRLLENGFPANPLGRPLARISHQLSTAAADPGMSTALRSVGRLDVLSNISAGLGIQFIIGQILPVHRNVRSPLGVLARKQQFFAPGTIGSNPEEVIGASRICKTVGDSLAIGRPDWVNCAF
jgi:hypothetical protein